MNSSFPVIFLVSLLSCAPPAVAERLHHHDDIAAPAQFIAFCTAFPDQCRTGNAGGVAMVLTAQREAQLRSVNQSVNRAIRQVSDRKLYGRSDHWTLPSAGAGDCEDIALLKRKRLLDLGWPTSALLVAIVRDERGNGHAVLAVVTDRGDLVLDNRTSSIRYPSQSQLEFHAMQSPSDPRRWTAIRAGTGILAVTATAGAARLYRGRPSLR